MQRVKAMTALFDLLGAGGLISATIALINLTMLAETLPETVALRLFQVSFTCAISAFATARLLQIGFIIRNSSNPRRVRAEKAAAIEALPQSAVEPVPNPFQRAA